MTAAPQTIAEYMAIRANKTLEVTGSPGFRFRKQLPLNPKRQFVIDDPKAVAPDEARAADHHCRYRHRTRRSAEPSSGEERSPNQRQTKFAIVRRQISKQMPRPHSAPELHVPRHQVLPPPTRVLARRGTARLTQ